MADQYAVIGNPVEHSLSPAIHAEFARATAQDIVYERILAPLDGFREAALRFRDAGGKGLNVTLPFKHEAWNLAGLRSGFALAARSIGAVLDYLLFSAKVDPDLDSLVATIKVVRWFVPDLSQLDWRDPILYGHAFPWAKAWAGLCMSTGYILLFLTVATLVYRKREFS